MEDRNRALEKERVSIDRLEAQVTELEGDAATNLVVLREMKERVARLEEENKQLKKNGQDYETEEPESEEEGEWEEGCDFLIIMTHQVPERRRLKDVEAEKWTGMFRDEFLAGL
jgi:chromosome segregation ATPase